MSVADSPLRDRVIFVEGAPRSGTTWLVSLLATHPQIAGVAAESHLFDFGLDRLFDNFEGADRWRRGLETYVERRELVDLARDLCDGVLGAMRSHVDPTLDSGFVVEKTPIGSEHRARDLRRKLECYPDAWYVHIVRDGEAVTRSLMSAPFMSNRSASSCTAMWRRSVDAIRETLGDHPRYREIRYEDLRAEPVRYSRELFRWLDVDAGDDVCETVRVLSTERFSDLGSVAERTPGAWARALVGEAQRSSGPHAALDAGRRRLAARSRRRATERPDLTFTFARALRGRDEYALRALTASSVTLVHRSFEGDASCVGDNAREALLAIAQELFAGRYVSEWWTTAPGQASEWWTSIPGRPFSALFFSGLNGDATRVDLALGLMVEDQVIARIVIVSAGPLAGRPVRHLSSPRRVTAPQGG